MILVDRFAPFSLYIYCYRRVHAIDARGQGRAVRRRFRRADFELRASSSSSASSSLRASRAVASALARSTSRAPTRSHRPRAHRCHRRKSARAEQVRSRFSGDCARRRKPTLSRFDRCPHASLGRPLRFSLWVEHALIPVQSPELPPRTTRRSRGSLRCGTLSWTLRDLRLDLVEVRAGVQRSVVAVHRSMSWRLQTPRLSPLARSLLMPDSGAVSPRQSRGTASGARAPLYSHWSLALAIMAGRERSLDVNSRELTRLSQRCTA